MLLAAHIAKPHALQWHTVRQARDYNRKFKLSALARILLTSLKTPQRRPNYHITMSPRGLLNLTRQLQFHDVHEHPLSLACRQASCPQRNAYLQRLLLRVQQAKHKGQHRVKMIRHHLLASWPAVRRFCEAGLHLQADSSRNCLTCADMVDNKHLVTGKQIFRQLDKTCL